MLLKNKDGKELRLDILSGEDAAQGAIDCLRSVYGGKDNYVNSKAFDLQWLKNEIRVGRIKVYTGITDGGEPAVTLSARKNRYFDRSIEICALAVNAKYKGFHLGAYITECAVSDCEKAGYFLFYAHIMMFHTLVGAIYEDKGFVPAGFLFGVCDAGKHLTELNTKSQKHSWAVYAKNSGKIESVTVYVPEYIKNFIKEVYTSLGAGSVFECRERALKGQSDVEYEQDDYHKTLYLYISKCGGNLAGKTGRIEQEYGDALQTCVAYLNINDPGAIRGFEILKESGYGFSGMKPLCGNHEFIIMAKTRKVFVDYSELKMSPALQKIFNGIESL